MSVRVPFVPAATCAVGLWVGYFLGIATPTSQAVQGGLPPPPSPKAAVTMDQRVAANLWLQTSAEYRACCLQTYRVAGDRLEYLVAALRPAKPAIVMDLDETVFDNSAFQTALYSSGKEYTPELWDDYEKNFPGEVRPVPGALEFVQRAEKLGVTPVFISNRSDPLKAGTIASLKHLGIGIEGIEARLFLKPKGASSEKSARREAVAARFNVLMYFGDNLRDFSEAFAAPKVDPAAGLDGIKAAIAERNRLADAAAVHWGGDWFVLPNPVYGEWDRMCGPDPRAVFPPTKLTFGKSTAVPMER